MFFVQKINRSGLKDKMLFKEIFYYFRSNKIITAFLVCQTSLFFVLLGTFISFTSEMHYGKDNLEKVYEDKSIYQLLDGYFDPDEFSAFRKQAGSLDIIKNYYKELNSAKNFKYLAMFNQGVFADNSTLNNLDFITQNDSSAIKINSFQMNLHAHDYFNLTVSEGRGFVEEDFENKDDVLPILIGSKYAEYFNVGDCIPVLYYQKEITLRVVGMLDENSFVYFNGDPEFYLDEYFVLPYINYTEPESGFEEEFQKIVYFAMINGYILTENSDAASNDMMAELESISQKTGFYNYLFIGSNPNFQPYRGLINVMNSNYALVKAFFGFSFFLNTITISLMLYFEQKKRLPSLAVHYLNGAAVSAIVKNIICETLCIIGFAFILSQILLGYVLKINDAVSQLFLLITAVVLTFCVSILPVYRLVNTQLTALLNNQEENL